MPDLVRRTLQDVQPYRVDGPGSAIDLSDNTSLWGPPPAAATALASLDPMAMASYPATPPASLLGALAAYAGVTPDMVVPGCGSDDLIDGAMRTFADPGDVIAFAAPTFSMVPTFARVNNLRIHAVPFDADLALDVDALLAPRPRIVYLCSPNNPTGAALARPTIERVLREAPGIVLLDEAYGEFTSAPGFDLVRTNPHLVVTRTLSKAFGLAGLRIGYAVLAPALARALEAVRGPYKVSVAGAAVAAAALTDGLPWVRARAAEVAGIRARVATRLVSAGFAPVRSDANFFCLPCAGALEVAEAARAARFALRVLRNLPPVTPAIAAAHGSALRFSIAPWALMERLLAVLEAERARCK